MNPIQLFDKDSSTFTYLLVDSVTRDAVLIDPVDTQIDRDLAVILSQQANLKWVVETHVHADHVTSAAQLGEHTGAGVAVPAKCGVLALAKQLNNGDKLAFGNEVLLALHTPGHTAGSMSYVWRNHVFTGDALLIDGCGRTDFQSGSADALYTSITDVLFALPLITLVWPAHDYKGRFNSTIGDEQKSNSRITGKSRAEFAQLMGALQLPKPKRIDEAVHANIWLGARHDAECISVPPI